MTPSKFPIITGLLFVLTACNQSSDQPGNRDKEDSIENATRSVPVTTQPADSLASSSNPEEKIIDTIFKLAEVQERSRYIEQQTKGKRHLKVWIESAPDSSGQEYYWVKAGEDNGTNLVTHFNFFVYPGLIRIMYYAPESDKEISLENWRKQLNDKQ